MTNDRITEIRARCEAGRPIRHFDVKYLLDKLAERQEIECEYATGDPNVTINGRPFIPRDIADAQLSERDREIDRLSQLAMMREGEIGDRDREIDRLREAQRWIPVTERPPMRADAMACLGDVAWLFPDRPINDGRVIALPWWEEKGATHWRKLPEPPESGESQ